MSLKYEPSSEPLHMSKAYVSQALAQSSDSIFPLLPVEPFLPPGLALQVTGSFLPSFNE